MMLNPAGVVVPDLVGRYRNPHADRIARAVADHVHLGGWCDELAWESLFTDESRMGRHRALYGNRPKVRPARSRVGQVAQESLF